MNRDSQWMEESELLYEVSARPSRSSNRPARRYSPRYDKKQSGSGSHGGIHRRGSR